MLMGLGQALAGDVVANLIVFDGEQIVYSRKTSTVTVVGEVLRHVT